MFHGVGVGKTCSAVTISESFRDIYVKENNKIIVLRKGGLGQGWKNTMFQAEVPLLQQSSKIKWRKGLCGIFNRKDSL